MYLARCESEEMKQLCQSLTQHAESEPSGSNFQTHSREGKRKEDSLNELAKRHSATIQIQETPCGFSEEAHRT